MDPFIFEFNSSDEDLTNCLEPIDSFVSSIEDTSLTRVPITETLDEIQIAVSRRGRKRKYPKFPRGFRKDACIKFFLRRFKTYLNEKCPYLSTEHSELWTLFFGTPKLPPECVGEPSCNDRYLSKLFAHSFFTEEFIEFFENQAEALIQTHIPPPHQQFYRLIGKRDLCRYHLSQEKPKCLLADNSEDFEKLHLLDVGANYMEGSFSGAESVQLEQKSSDVFSRMRTVDREIEDRFNQLFE